VLLRILVAVGSPSLRRRLGRLLQEGEVLVTPAGPTLLWKRLNQGDYDLIVTDRTGLPSPSAAAIDQIRKLPERPEVVVIEDGAGGPEQRDSLLAAGCLAVVSPATSDATFADTMRALVARCRDEASARLRMERLEARSRLDDFVSASPVMQRFMELSRRVVRAESSLLILGETGVGKERLARAIHAEGPRGSGPFVAVNCGALPESLLESELFGHEEGAFTGASRARRGYFELAHRGTVFLDEIGEVPLHLQVKLLRVLEDRRIQRLGSERPIEIDVRVIAATNRDLEAEVQARRFRSDLYFRLAVVTLTLPPLRERREDIPPLVRDYLGHFGRRLARTITEVSPEAMRALVAYSWPGNVRELINVVEQVVLLSGGPGVEVADLPRRILEALDSGAGRPLPDATAALDRTLGEGRRQIVDEFERAYLTGALSCTGGSIKETARRAGITPRRLHDLMRRHRLDKNDFKTLH